MIFLFEKNNWFLKVEISGLDDKIKELIFYELITVYKGKDYEEQKNGIYDLYLDKIDTKEGREKIIKLILKLKGDDKKYFISEKILEKCQFTKEEFFSNKENYKILTLCFLQKELIYESYKEDIKYEDNILNIYEYEQQGNKYAKNLINILDNIRNDLDKGIITKKDLEKFLGIKRGRNYWYKKEIEEKKNDESEEYIRDKL